MVQILSWQAQLSSARPGDHVVQLYTDEAFVIRAMTYFVSHGLEAGEAAVLFVTPDHMHAIGSRLAGHGFDVPAMMARGQVVFRDALLHLRLILRDGRPDHETFCSAIEAAFARTSGHPRVRLVGEMVNLLWARDQAATIELEDLWSEVLLERSASLLCPYRLDNFDADVHRAGLAEICLRHSQLIPAENYERLATAVDQAYLDVFGAEAEARSVRARLLATYTPPAVMPEAEAALFALRLLDPQVAGAVLDRARLHYGVA